MQSEPRSWRSYAKAALRPLAAPLLTRLYSRVDQRVSEHLQRSADTTLAQHLPALLNAISTQNAAARELRRSEIGFREELKNVWNSLTAHAERIGDVERRGEFIRRELLVSMRQLGGERSVSEIIEPRIVDAEKVATMSPLRINVGCGHIPLDGFVNVDARELPGVDVVADARRLPFDPGTVAEMYTAHMVEHFPLDDLERIVLPHWRDLLEPGGILHLVVPDSGAMLEDYGAGRMSFEDLRMVTFGDQEYEGDFHFTMFTSDTLTELLERAGFTPVKVMETGRRNGACLEMEISAMKPLEEQAPAHASS